MDRIGWPYIIRLQLATRREPKFGFSHNLGSPPEYVGGEAMYFIALHVGGTVFALLWEPYR